MKKFTLPAAALAALLALAACENDTPPATNGGGTLHENPDIDECPRKDGHPCF